MKPFGGTLMKLRQSKEADQVSQENMEMVRGLRALLEDPSTSEKQKEEIRRTFKDLLKKTDHIIFNGKQEKKSESE